MSRSAYLALVIMLSLFSLARSKSSSFRTATKLFASTFTPAPASSVVDYCVKSKVDVENIFKPSDTSMDSNTTELVIMVPKSSYDDFKASKLSPDTLNLLENVGMKMEKFPGTKLMHLPLNGEKKTKIAFYDDSQLGSKYITFGSILKSLEGKKQYKFVDMNHGELESALATQLAFTFAMSNYGMDMFKKKASIKTDDHQEYTKKQMIWPKNSDSEKVIGLARSYYLMKDLVDSPALNVGPSELGEVVVNIAKENGVSEKDIHQYIGVEELDGFPMTAAVGMASPPGREPRVIDFTWMPKGSNEKDLVEVVVIGKGVVFDTGGLNIKGPSMKGMKKDMAGSAQAIALSALLMHNKCNIKLRTIIPIAENSVAGNSIRPSDVIRGRNGKTTEITNTDAEGRLLLGDCLAAACEHLPEESKGGKRRLIIDFATLTGAARVALGTELPAIFSNDHTELMKVFDLSHSLDIDGIDGEDPLWPMPLWENMRGELKSSIADLVNAPGGMGGAITAAVYLSEFITPLTCESASSSAYLSSKSKKNKSEEKKEDDDEEENNGNAEASESEGSKKLVAPVWFHIDFMGTRPAGLRTMYAYINKYAAGK